jgi:tagatose-6-phosphate ketose/aldose isomerase
MFLNMFSKLSMVSDCFTFAYILKLYNMASIQTTSFDTIHEIYQQPEMWRQTYQILLDKEKEISGFMTSYYNEETTIILTGAGTSSFIGNILEFVMPKYGFYSVKSVPTTDITTHPEAIFNKYKKYILVSFARSGNSPESLAAVNIADSICHNNIAHIIITCNENGKLVKEKAEDNRLILILPPETNDKGLAMTSSFSSMLLVSMLLFDVKKIVNKKEGIDNLYKKGEYLISTYSDQIKKIAALDFERTVFLGTGELKGIAEECHLKLQELTDGKVVCLFDSFLGLRHGPKAAINEKTLLVYLFSNDDKVFQYERDLVAQTNQQVKPIAQIYVSQKKRSTGNVVLDEESALKEMKATSDDNYIYIYLVLEESKVFPIDIFINADNNSSTGGNTWLWDPCGAEFLLEGFISANLEDVTVFNFPADAAQDDWAWTEVLGPGSGIIKMSSPKTINGDIVAIEMYIIKEMIPATLAPEIGIGIFSSDENWSDNGVLPNTATGDPAPLMTLKLQ